MWVSSLRLQHVRSFEDYRFDFSRTINVLVGPNSAGKSTVLLPLLGLQYNLPTLDEGDVRANCDHARVEIELADRDPQFFHDYGKVLYVYPTKAASGFPLLGERKGVPSALARDKISSSEPNNFIVPFLSRRWAAERSFDADSKNAHAVHPDLRNVDAKIDIASTSQITATRDFYNNGCTRTLGHSLVPIPSAGGRQTVYTINDQHSVPLDRMGAGARNIAGLLALMAGAKGKLFIIEEPENDIHPEALRQLLSALVEALASNQFIITTHSHIVLNVLGGAPEAKTWYIDIAYPDRVPTSSVKEIGPDEDERLWVLDQLGYEFADMCVWDAWLLLEESSAERIIRDFLMPWFAPYLCGRLRTCSAGSLSNVKGRFRALNDLFVFVHLTPTYKNRAWVVVDAGDEEQKIIEKLRKRYKPRDWKEGQFRQWDKHDFEDYYPARFGDERTRVSGIPPGKEKRAAKKALLYKVLDWIDEDKEGAKTEFEESAKAVIEVLQEIQEALRGDGGEEASS